MREYRGWRGRIIAATPLICLIVYLLIGYLQNIWHPTWAIFFLIIIVPVMLSDNVFESIYPIIVVTTYLVLGLTINWWHPGWIIFLTIPVYYILFGPLFRRRKRVHKEKSAKSKIIEIIENFADDDK